MKVFLYVLTFQMSFFGFCQDLSEKQRLLSIIDTTTIVKDKVQLYADMAWEYIITENDSALIFADTALQFSIDNQYPLGQAIALETKGLYHEIATGNYGMASKYYFESIDVCETNQLDYISSIYHSLGVMFHTSDNFEKAQEYYSTSYNLAKKANDSILIKKCLINLGSVNSSLKNFDKAAAYMEASLNIEFRREMDYTTYCNLGNLYTKQKLYNKALPYLLKATEQHPDNPDSESNLYFLLDLKTLSNDTIGIKPILKRAKAAVNTAIGPRSKSLLLLNIANYYKSIGNYKEADAYRADYIEVFEKIKEQQRDLTVLELETKYETEKKDAQLKLLQAETEKKEQQKKLYSTLAIAGLFIASLLGFFGYKNRQKNILLAEQKRLLETTLDEKNVLLRETHHRVKNSFQIVSSLLFLQSKNVKDKNAQIAIQEAQNRVRSMVLIHQRLYNKDQLVGIDTQDYFEDLTRDIFDSHQQQSQGLNYELNVEPMVLGIETITPIGLILNELIVNVLKHGFDEVTLDSKMNITFKQQDAALVLKVSDNGKGFEGEIKETSFGIKLIKALAKKLKANLVFNSSIGKGTEAILNITKFEML